MQTSLVQTTSFNLDGFFSWFGHFIGYFFSVNFFTFMFVLSTLFTIALITLVIFLIVRLYEIRQEDAKIKKAITTPTGMPMHNGPSSSDNNADEGTKQNETWIGIRERLLSDNNSDWKLAIIEADIYLDRVLDDKGFHGDTTSDKLKQVTPDRLPSIQIAWEAHKIRNRIAHDGAAFVLTMPEARRLLSYFEIVFTDLG